MQPVRSHSVEAHPHGIWLGRFTAFRAVLLSAPNLPHIGTGRARPPRRGVQSPLDTENEYAYCVSMRTYTVRAARRRAGLRQVDLAKISGVSQTAISNLERGACANPRLETLRQLASALDLSITQLRFNAKEAR